MKTWSEGQGGVANGILGLQELWATISNYCSDFTWLSGFDLHSNHIRIGTVVKQIFYGIFNA